MQPGERQGLGAVAWRGSSLEEKASPKSHPTAHPGEDGAWHVAGGSYGLCQCKGLLIGAAFNPFIFAEVMHLWQ